MELEINWEEDDTMLKNSIFSYLKAFLNWPEICFKIWKMLHIPKEKPMGKSKVYLQFQMLEKIPTHKYWR